MRTSTRTGAGGSTQGPVGGTRAQGRPTADPDADDASNMLEYLTGTHPLQAASFWSIAMQKTNAAAQIIFPQIEHASAKGSGVHIDIWLGG